MAMFLTHSQGLPELLEPSLGAVVAPWAVATRCDGLRGFFGFAATDERVPTFRNLHQPQEVGEVRKELPKYGSTPPPPFSLGDLGMLGTVRVAISLEPQNKFKPGGFDFGKLTTTSDKELVASQSPLFTSRYLSYVTDLVQTIIDFIFKATHHFPNFSPQRSPSDKTSLGTQALRPRKTSPFRSAHCT